MKHKSWSKILTSAIALVSTSLATAAAEKFYAMNAEGLQFPNDDCSGELTDGKYGTLSMMNHCIRGYYTETSTLVNLEDGKAVVYLFLDNKACEGVSSTQIDVVETCDGAGVVENRIFSFEEGEAVFIKNDRGCTDVPDYDWVHKTGECLPKEGGNSGMYTCNQDNLGGTISAWGNANCEGTPVLTLPFDNDVCVNNAMKLTCKGSASKVVETRSPSTDTPSATPSASPSVTPSSSPSTPQSASPSTTPSSSPSAASTGSPTVTTSSGTTPSASALLLGIAAAAVHCFLY